jgi:hypothetical protein
MHNTAGESEFNYLQKNTCESDHVEYLQKMTGIYKMFTFTFQFA